MATEYQADVLVTVTNGKESFIITVFLKQSEEYSKISYIRDKRWISVTVTIKYIWYICSLQLGWHPVAVVQYTFTHKQYIEQHNWHKQYKEQHN
jgi:DNA polymerase III alpha subunit (gram-positive type)